MAILEAGTAAAAIFMRAPYKKIRLFDYYATPLRAHSDTAPRCRAASLGASRTLQTSLTTAAAVSLIEGVLSGGHKRL